jgi:hypothetical protein
MLPPALCGLRLAATSIMQDGCPQRLRKGLHGMRELNVSKHASMIVDIRGHRPHCEACWQVRLALSLPLSLLETAAQSPLSQPQISAP